MKKSNIFWIGYSDLMTSLFFVMLVLFVVTIGFLQYRIRTTEKELEKIKELQAAVQELPEEYFDYQPQYKRFKLKEHVQFDDGKSYIKPKYYDYLTKVGNAIKLLIDDLNSNDELRELDIKYLVVIEGMASKDAYSENFELSYERALSLYRFWIDRKIEFNPESCEIQISGSGTGGIREYSGDEERLNQQFLIHIIPKLGKVEIPGEDNNTIEENKKESIVVGNREDSTVEEESNEERLIEESSPPAWRYEYDSVGLSGEIGLHIVLKDEKFGVINDSGKMVTPLKYDMIGQYSEGLAMVGSNDSCGYINTNGQEVISLQYNGCEKFNAGRAKVFYMGREIYINTEGNLMGIAE